VAIGLREAGHDAIHVRDRIAADSRDELVLDLAAAEDRVLVSADTDFAEILALRTATRPSFVLLRLVPETIAGQIGALVSSLPGLESDLLSGVVAVIEESRIRVRRLPLLDAEADDP
jgi:predicted nuclease of predicted toxin-antitoxin system